MITLLENLGEVVEDVHTSGPCLVPRCVTSLTPDPIHLLSLYPMCCTKEVSNLINHLVVSLFGCGKDSTGSNMITKQKKLDKKLYSTYQKNP